MTVPICPLYCLLPLTYSCLPATSTRFRLRPSPLRVHCRWANPIQGSEHFYYSRLPSTADTSIFDRPGSFTRRLPPNSFPLSRLYPSRKSAKSKRASHRHQPFFNASTLRHAALKATVDAWDIGAFEADSMLRRPQLRRLSACLISQLTLLPCTFCIKMPLIQCPCVRCSITKSRPPL